MYVILCYVNNDSLSKDLVRYLFTSLVSMKIGSRPPGKKNSHYSFLPDYDSFLFLLLIKFDLTTITTLNITISRK